MYDMMNGGTMWGMGSSWLLLSVLPRAARGWSTLRLPVLRSPRMRLAPRYGERGRFQPVRVGAKSATDQTPSAGCGYFESPYVRTMTPREQYNDQDYSPCPPAARMALFLKRHCQLRACSPRTPRFPSCPSRPAQGNCCDGLGGHRRHDGYCHEHAGWVDRGKPGNVRKGRSVSLRASGDPRAVGHNPCFSPVPSGVTAGMAPGGRP